MNTITRDEWPEQIRGGLESLLDELAARPEMAEAIIRPPLADGRSAYERRLGFLETLSPVFKGGRDFSPQGEALPPRTELLAAASAGTLIWEEIEAGRAEQLPSQIPSILFSALVPFIGRDEAAATVAGVAA